MLIGEIVKQTGIGKDGIRYYEQLGLIYSSPKPAGSRVYRDYHDDTLKRIEMIECGKSAGFSLKEIQPLLSLFLAGEMAPEHTDQLLKQKLQELEQRQQAIIQMKALLQEKLIG